MEQRLQHLVRRLAFIGYRPHEITHIVKASARDKTSLVGQLERYEQLGLHYLTSYSK